MLAESLHGSVDTQSMSKMTTRDVYVTHGMQVIQIVSLLIQTALTEIIEKMNIRTQYE